MDFADLLRRLRLGAGLSQEALAELAGISVKAVSAYERGLRFAPRKHTVAALVDALKLAGPQRTEFENTAAGKRGVASAPEPAHNLPWQPTSFVGRQREVEEITALLSQRRVITLTGSGGIGKTRTALEVASRIQRPPRDGIWFVDLAPLNDPNLVVTKIASAVDLRLSDGDALLAALVGAIASREMLLILDNCEHVIVAVRAAVEAILQRCPRISLIATSRERLRIAGEVTYQLSTLPVPTKSVTTCAESRSYDALELFVERAASNNAGFVFSDEHVAPAVDICRRLDGIALAIELAAARLPVLGLCELQAQLAQHFSVIAGGRDDLPARQRTLHAAISWSHDLLSDVEQTVFRRLAVFASGWTLEAAALVCADGALGADDVLEALFSLAEKSLVIVDADAETPRYSFFESTRMFAAQRLASSNDAAAVSRRHAQWMVTFADRAYELYLVTPRWRWETAVASEVDNALAALDWGLGADGDSVLAGRIASALYGFWLTPGLAVYGKRYLNAAIGRIDSRVFPALTARLLVAQACQFLHGKACANAMTKAISLLEGSDDRRTLARCYLSLAHALAQIGAYPQAQEASDASLALLRDEGLQRSALYARLVSDRSRMFRMQGRFEEARVALTQALSLAVDLEDDWSISLCQMILAEIEFVAGDAWRTVALGEEALASARRVRQEIYALCNLACYQLAVGAVDGAQAHAREALELARGCEPNVVQAAVAHLAVVAALRDQPVRAARLLGYVDAWYERIGSARDATDAKGYAMLMEALRRQLPDHEIAAHAAQGAHLSEEAAIDEALSFLGV